ncbi:uncharacterized protein LOC141854815 [Brevipalpus obovatus]|uniref:uncharacterized protein LOC141854815 n=1 Tax=Brevipalpus obovatus TaxID=246614 RepID=UPI003D9F0E53
MRTLIRSIKPLLQISSSSVCPKYQASVINERNVWKNVPSKSIATSATIEKAAQLVDTDTLHFDIRNLIPKENDLSMSAFNKVSQLRENLSGISHPIIPVAQEIFEAGSGETRASQSSLGGFCLLLLAKSLQAVPTANVSSEIWEKQKIFAECCEMIDKAMYIHHHAIIDFPMDFKNVSLMNAKNSGNKLAVLGGDYLFSFSIMRLASLVRQTNVFDFIGASIDGFCINHFDQKYALDRNEELPPTSAFVHSRHSQNHHSWDLVDKNYWEKFGGYCSTDLLAYSCQYITKMANLTSIRYDRAAFKFGYNLRLLWNVKDDLQSFSDEKSQLNLISLPLIEYLEENPNFRNIIAQINPSDEESIAMIRKAVNNSGAIDRCQKYMEEYSKKCNKALELFPECKSRDILEFICNYKP